MGVWDDLLTSWDREAIAIVGWGKGEVLVKTLLY